MIFIFADMKNIYNIYKLASRIKSQRLKLLGIALFHIMGRRYAGIFFDPILACNFRCKMCYFSNKKKRQTTSGIMPVADAELIAKSMFHRALKLQIGCGAEPTLYRDIEKIIRLGRQYGIPYISLTTNGYLLTKESLCRYIEAGLNEVTLSMHGVTKTTYEMLMVNGNYEKFRSLINAIIEIKRLYPHFKLRINYTMNADNVEELASMFECFPDLPVDVLQLRPIQKIGDSEYNNFSTDKLTECYDTVISPLQKECEKRGITCIAPSKENLAALDSSETDDMISEFTYWYISPSSCWKADYDFHTDTFESYSRKHGVWRQIIKAALLPTRKHKVNVTRKMNYSVK